MDSNIFWGTFGTFQMFANSVLLISLLCRNIATRTTNKQIILTAHHFYISQHFGNPIIRKCWKARDTETEYAFENYVLVNPKQFSIFFVLNQNGEQDGGVSVNLPKSKTFLNKGTKMPRSRFLYSFVFVAGGA